jgi:hypothetical protein
MTGVRVNKIPTGSARGVCDVIVLIAKACNETRGASPKSSSTTKLEPSRRTDAQLGIPNLITRLHRHGLTACRSRYYVRRRVASESAGSPNLPSAHVGIRGLGWQDGMATTCPRPERPPHHADNVDYWRHIQLRKRVVSALVFGRQSETERSSRFRRHERAGHFVPAG